MNLITLRVSLASALVAASLPLAMNAQNDQMNSEVAVLEQVQTTQSVAVESGLQKVSYRGGRKSFRRGPNGEIHIRKGNFEMIKKPNGEVDIRKGRNGEIRIQKDRYGRVKKTYNYKD